MHRILPMKDFILTNSSRLRVGLAALFLLAALPSSRAQQPTPASSVAGEANSVKVLFIGNSFTFGAGSPVRFFRPQSVTDLNGSSIGGVPALFKAFTVEAGLDYSVSLETMGGTGIDDHLERKADVVARPWDFVVMHGYSTLDKKKPGEPDVLVESARRMAELLHRQNPQVDIRLEATWSRADQTYPESGHWHGQPIDAMAKDVRAGYNLAAAGTPFIRGVIPVGEAWNRAMATGVADPNPYDGIAAGQVDLWTHDHYHGSTYGYYLAALMIFGDLTGLDPRSLGEGERAALELGMSQSQTAALQRIAYDQLMAGRSNFGLGTFAPVALPH